MAKVPVTFVFVLLVLVLNKGDAISRSGFRRRRFATSVPGQFLVTRKAELTGNLAAHLREANLEGLKILQEYRFGTLNTVLAEVKGNKNEIIKSINDLPMVESVQENFKTLGMTNVEKEEGARGNPTTLFRHGTNKAGRKRWRRVTNENLCCRDGLSHLPSGTTPSDTWALQRISSRDRPPGRKGLAWKEAYQRLHGFMEGGVGAGAGVDIYVLDTGINLNHSEFRNGGVTRGRWGFTASLFRDSEGDVDGYGHGTHVASSAMGSHIGVARKATVIAVKVLNNYNQGDESTAIEGLEWVYNQVQNQRNNGQSPKPIINMSLGIPRIAYPQKSAALDMVLDKVIEAGIHVVVAAGNSNQDACDWAPASHPGVLTVGASNPDDRIWHYSNYGRCVDILAPGEFVYGAATGLLKANSQQYVLQSGTSHASPIVTGVLAGYLSFLSPNTTPAQLKNRAIQRSTKDKLLGLTRRKAETPNILLFHECFHSKPF